MAKTNLLINVTTKGVKTASSGIKKLSGSLVSLSKFAMVGATGGAVALGVAMKKATSAAAEQELQERKLAQALGKNTDALLKQAGALQQTSRFGDEAIIQQQAYLASIGMSEQQIKDMIPVTLDLASATGMSLESAVKNTAKTLSGMQGELGESVGALKNLSAEELKAGKGIEVMREMFKGAAEAEIKTFSGAMDQAKNAMGDATEALGKLLLPMATEGAKVLKQFSEDAINAFDFIGNIDFKETFNNLKENVGLIGKFMIDSFKLSFSFIPDIFGFAFNKILPMAGKVLTSLLEGVKNVGGFLFEPLFIGIQIVIGKIRNSFITMTNFLKEQFNVLIGIANTLGANIQPLEMGQLIDLEGLSMANAEVVQLFKQGSEDNINTLTDLAGAQSELLGEYLNKIIVKNKEVEKSEENKNETSNEGTKKRIFFNKKLTSTELAGFAKTTGSAKDAMKSAVKNASMEGVANLIASILKTVPFPVNAILAAGAGATVSGIMDKGLASFATGGDFVTSGPQLIKVGDNMGGRERVQVTPLSSPNINGPQGQGSVTINVSGNVMSQDYVEGELAEQIKEAIRRGNDFGVS